MQAGNDCSTNSLAQCPPTCHCEAPKGPWQSRRTRLDNRSLPAKTQPVAGDSHVASLLEMTNLGALHVHRECLHICNCQWRSLSAATDAIGLCVFIDALCELQVPSRDCHVGLRPPRNDNSGAGAILTAAGTGRECSAGSGMPLPYNAYTKTPNGRGLRPGHGFYTRREEGWKTCGGILLTFRASA